MTPAEQALFDAALAHYGEHTREEMAALRDAVLMERLPEGFERNMEQLVERYLDASIALSQYQSKHQLGGEIRTRLLNELRGAQACSVTRTA